MAVGDHFTVQINGFATTTLQTVDNVFVYEGIDGLCTASDLGAAFVADVVFKIVSMSSSQWNLGTFQITNLDDPDDFITIVSEETGLLGGDYMPIFVTAGFRFVRTTRAVQNGRKNIGIIPEDQVNAGIPTAPYQILLDNLATAMLQDIQGGSPESNFRPRIWRRPGTYESGTVDPPGLFYPVGDVVFTKITTMNSRKP